MSTDAPAPAHKPPELSEVPHTDQPHHWRTLVARPHFALLGVVLTALVVRLFRINDLGFNSDEAVYGGQAASLAGNPLYTDLFPVFRAHPMLVQVVVSPLFREGVSDWQGRVVVALVGVVTILVAYAVGRDLYGRRVGLLAAALLAVMPYHVIPTRQLLLDGPMVLFTTLALWALTKYALTHRGAWLVTSGAFLGLAMLCKETAIVMAGAYYAFFALAASVPIKWRAVGGAFAAMVGVFAIHPITSALAGGGSKSKSYLVWQLLREPNHEWTFYPTVVTVAIGPLVLAAAIGGLIWARRSNSWREVLLCSWALVPAVAFQLWPVKGFQYLLPAAVPVAILAARGALALTRPESGWRRWLVPGVVALLLLSLTVPTIRAVASTGRSTFLAGTGGVPGGREAGTWIAENTPEGSVVMTLGPSMANIVQYYGHRRAYGLAVSPNPLKRNPSYEPIVNPDAALRYSQMQYVVWDAYSAARSPHFSETLLTLARRYNGRVVHTETVETTTPAGKPTAEPVIVVFAVWSLPAAPSEEEGNPQQ